MVDRITNDNDGARAPAPPGRPDAHGQAALLLVESLIHGLIARSVITVADAVEIVGVATDVKAQISADLGDSPATLRKLLDPLSAISMSLAHDLPDADPKRPSNIG